MGYQTAWILCVGKMGSKITVGTTNILIKACRVFGKEGLNELTKLLIKMLEEGMIPSECND